MKLSQFISFNKHCKTCISKATLCTTSLFFVKTWNLTHALYGEWTFPSQYIILMTALMMGPPKYCVCVQYFPSTRNMGQRVLSWTMGRLIVLQEWSHLITLWQYKWVELYYAYTYLYQNEGICTANRGTLIFTFESRKDNWNISWCYRYYELY